MEENQSKVTPSTDVPYTEHLDQQWNTKPQRNRQYNETYPPVHGQSFPPTGKAPKYTLQSNGSPKQKLLLEDRHTWIGFALGVVVGIAALIAVSFAVAPNAGDSGTNTRNPATSKSVSKNKYKLPHYKDIESFCGSDNGQVSLNAASDGTSISLVIPRMDDESYQVLQCVNIELDAPDSAVSKMQQTNGLSGTQHDSWNNVKVTWSYNGKSGFMATYEIKD